MTNPTQPMPGQHYPPTPAAFERPAPTSARPWRRRPWILAAAVCLALIAAATIAAVVAANRAPATINLTGTLTLNSIDHSTFGCNGTGGYSDLSAGAQVTVTDQTGAVLGASELETGSQIDSGCRWSFHIANIPAGRDFYGVTVSHRGTIQYTEQQIRDGVDLSIGR